VWAEGLRNRTPLALIAVAASLVLSGYLLLGARDASRLDDATAALEQHHYTQAIERAGQVNMRPATGGALAVRARALVGLGRAKAALSAYRDAVSRAPSDWQLRSEWAQLLLRTGQRAAAQTQMNRARALNPLLVLPQGFSARTLRNPRGAR
jgi:Tfp pilus assembly protein PilF